MKKFFREWLGIDKLEGRLNEPRITTYCDTCGLVIFDKSKAKEEKLIVDEWKHSGSWVWIGPSKDIIVKKHTCRHCLKDSKKKK